MAKKATTLHDNLGNDLLPVTNASITFMDDGNSVQAEINDLKEKTRYNKGHFSTPEALNLAYPSTNPDGSIISDADSKLREGWYAIVGSTDTVWIWDVEGKEWVNSGSTTGAVESVNGLNGEVILTGGNINATATINDTSKTELINAHLTDVYSELSNKVNNDEFSQEIQNITDIIPTKVSELTNDSNYATEQYVEENGGKIDTISVNGVQQDIINKNVDISIPTDNNQLANGAGYQTSNDVNILISDATQNMLTTSNYPSTLDSVYQKVGDYATITDLETKQDKLTSTQLQAVNSGANTTNINQITTNSNNINAINSKIPNQASSTNQLADKDFVNSSLNSITAFYITSNSNGDPFPTKSALINATTYYSGGEVRTPTRNDYAIILQDESEENATTRYIYYNQWEYQYTVNETPLTADQLSAINSGITSTLVGKISSNEANINSISNELSTNYAKKSELNNYLPKTGGTLTATSGDTALSVQSKSTASYIGFKDSNGSLLGYYGVNSSKKPVFYSGGDKVLAYASDIPTKTSQLTNDSEFINKDVNNLTNYTLAVNTASSIEMSIDDSTYVVSLKLKNAEGTQLGDTQTIDLPLESVVVNGAYDSNTKEVVLTLDNGSEIRFSVADLVSGLQSEITTTNKLSSDLVDDTNSTNKFVTSSEKETWNNKSNFSGSYNDLTDKPSLATVATSGSYNDLLNKPTIPTNYVTTDTKQNITSSKIFTKGIGVGLQSDDYWTITGDTNQLVIGKGSFDTSSNHTGKSPDLTLKSTGQLIVTNSGGTQKTVAYTSDIPTNYVTTNTEQTITGAKTFNKEAYFNGDRMTITSGNPVPFQYQSGKRGLMIYSDGIAIASNKNNDNNDSAWIRHIEDTVNDGSLEIAVGDDNTNEYIKFRGYNTNSQIAWESVIPRKSGTIALTSDLGTQATYSLSGTTLTITPK